MELIKIGDAAVSEEKVVETTAMASTENKEESKTEKKSTSTKKATSTKQARGTGKVKLIREKEDEEVSLFKENIYVVFVECETPGNVGFLARTMANFGLKNLVLINPTKLTNEAYYQAIMKLRVKKVDCPLHLVYSPLNGTGNIPVREIMNDPTLKPYFAPGVMVLNETSILCPNGHLRRPDRIVFMDDEVMVMDYKTGKENDDYQKQLDEYCALLEQMGYKNVHSRLIYL